MFGYDKFVAMTSGAEAADSAVKIARKWGYMTKKIPEGECHILTASKNYHGATLSTQSLASKKSNGKILHDSRLNKFLSLTSASFWTMGPSSRTYITLG
jgi:acetylornithine/succinyldiaminopimelate/putrescine aminotransferase